MARRGHRPVRVSEDTSVLIPAVLAAVAPAMAPMHAAAPAAAAPAKPGWPAVLF